MGLAHNFRLLITGQHQPIGQVDQLSNRHITRLSSKAAAENGSIALSIASLELLSNCQSSLTQRAFPGNLGLLGPPSIDPATTNVILPMVGEPPPVDFRGPLRHWVSGTFMNMKGGPELPSILHQKFWEGAKSCSF